MNDGGKEEGVRSELKGVWPKEKMSGVSMYSEGLTRDQDRKKERTKKIWKYFVDYNN